MNKKDKPQNGDKDKDELSTEKEKQKKNEEVKNTKEDKFMVIDRPFIVKKGKAKEFLDAFNNIPSLSEEYLEECKKVAKESERLEKEWEKRM